MFLLHDGACTQKKCVHLRVIGGGRAVCRVAVRGCVRYNFYTERVSDSDTLTAQRTERARERELLESERGLKD